MQQILSGIVLIRMLIWRGGWRALRAFLVTVFVGSVAVQWHSLSYFEKAVVIVGGLIQAGDAIDAFLDQTFSRFQAGKSLIPSGDTKPPFPIERAP